MTYLTQKNLITVCSKWFVSAYEALALLSAFDCTEEWIHETFIYTFMSPPPRHHFKEKLCFFKGTFSSFTLSSVITADGVLLIAVAQATVCILILFCMSWKLAATKCVPAFSTLDGSFVFEISYPRKPFVRKLCIFQVMWTVDKFYVSC